jgi:autotransporter family porin
MAAQSTAFDVDYALAVARACFEGRETWLGNGYHAGDIWGCVGRWFSGDWYEGSGGYIANVKNILANKPWLRSGF